METVEIVVYIGIAVIVGGLVVAFLGGFDAGRTYERISGIFSGERADAYERIEPEGLPAAALELWESCGLGSVARNKTVQVDGEGSLNRSALFASIKAASLCRTLQSASEGCGEREDVVFAPTQAPAVLTISCDPSSRTLRIDH